MSLRPRKVADDSPYPPGWEPFLAAINADLGDDTARLVFADWLQENGDEHRAEFVRVQCELFRAHPGYDNSFDLIRTRFSDAQRALHAREQSLLAVNRGRWARGLPAVLAGHGWSFRRGFVFHVSGTAKQWVAHGDRVRALTPLESLGLSRIAGAKRVLRYPTLAGLRRLFLTGMTTAGFAGLIESPALPSLDGLAVGECEDSIALRGAAAALAHSPRLAPLTRLWVRRAPVGDAVAHGLSQNPAAPGLVECELLNTGLIAPWFERFVNAPAAAGLRILNVQANHLGDDGAGRLVESPLDALEELNLRYNTLTAAAARALAGWEGLRSVRTLRLAGNAFGPDGCRALLQSEHLTNAETVELPVLGVHKADRERLAALPEAARVRLTFA